MLYYLEPWYILTTKISPRKYITFLISARSSTSFTLCMIFHSCGESIIYSSDYVKHDMRIARNSRFRRHSQSRFCEYQARLRKNLIKWLHKIAKIAFVRVFRYSELELRFQYAFRRNVRLRTRLLFKPIKTAFAERGMTAVFLRPEYVFRN